MPRAPAGAGRSPWWSAATANASVTFDEALPVIWTHLTEQLDGVGGQLEVVSVDPLSHALVVTVGQRRCAPQRCWTRRGSRRDGGARQLLAAPGAEIPGPPPIFWVDLVRGTEQSHQLAGVGKGDLLRLGEPAPGVHPFGEHLDLSERRRGAASAWSAGGFIASSFSAAAWLWMLPGGQDPIDGGSDLLAGNRTGAPDISSSS